MECAKFNENSKHFEFIEFEFWSREEEEEKTPTANETDRQRALPIV